MKTQAIRGIVLFDCIIYLAALAVILGLAFSAFFQVLDHSTELGRTAQATVQALQAGEQWREDIRAAAATVRLLPVDGSAELRITGAAGEIAYAFRDGSVWRRAGPGAPWTELLKEVSVSRMTEDRRRQVAAWRWDLELASRRANTKFRRVLTFQAVPATRPDGQPLRKAAASP